ncbi:RNA polymerase sigma factor [Sporohalobacter salinus]|uniref:RNA polymerase sigma factor n=1 Tax=Sporohalobacter salinus TaxID=1494606 RepID=UPI0019617511|nr:sigma-70 region 4 domain-containing protein [Sporohalobacter salinus]MBM7624769.1 DNA-directed RNA polymerase specialized sigma subunit [Sporohalobacter salinus]
MDNEKKEVVEDVLRDYPKLKAKIKIRVIQSFEEYSLASIDYQKVAGGTTNNIYSSVEDHLVRKSKKKSEVVKMIAKRDKIEAALKSLPRKQRMVIQYKYFDCLKVEDIAYEMNGIGEATVYRYIEDGISNLIDVELHMIEN